MELNASWNLSSEYDLCFTYVGHIFEELRSKYKKTPFVASISDDLILSNEEYEQLDAIEDVIMIGYPVGLFDEFNNMPLVRRGITATHPARNFNNLNLGLVDIACFKGSSGSPIFIMNKGQYKTRSEHFIGRDRLIFLGVLFAGPSYTATGDIKIVDVPTIHSMQSQTKTMINLGVYVKATELRKLK